MSLWIASAIEYAWHNTLTECMEWHTGIHEEETHVKHCPVTSKKFQLGEESVNNVVKDDGEKGRVPMRVSTGEWVPYFPLCIHELAACWKSICRRTFRWLIINCSPPSSGLNCDIFLGLISINSWWWGSAVMLALNVSQSYIFLCFGERRFSSSSYNALHGSFSMFFN